jgi:hypothetical protein
MVTGTVFLAIHWPPRVLMVNRTKSPPSLALLRKGEAIRHRFEIIY